MESDNLWFSDMPALDIASNIFAKYLLETLSSIMNTEIVFHNRQKLDSPFWNFHNSVRKATDKIYCL